jgi:hypothetical protein
MNKSIQLLAICLMLSVAVESKNFYINHLNPGDRLINFKRSEATLNEKEKGGSVKTEAPISGTPEAEKRAVIVSPHINAHDISMISFRKRSEPNKRGFLITGGNWFNTKQLSLRKRAKRGFTITGGNHYDTTRNGRPFTPKFLQRRPQQARPNQGHALAPQLSPTHAPFTPQLAPTHAPSIQGPARRPQSYRQPAPAQQRPALNYKQIPPIYQRTTSAPLPRPLPASARSYVPFNFWKDDHAIYSGSFDTSKLDINRIIQDFWNS